MSACQSTYVVDASLILACELETDEHKLRNPFIPRFGDRHQAQHIGLSWYWDDEEARIAEASK